MKILVTGAEGYIGNAIVQRLLNNNHKVIGVDSHIKSKWLKERNSISVIDSNKQKNQDIKKIYPDYEFYNFNISKHPQKLEDLFKKNKFDTIINLAQMPAAPYSQIDLKHSSWTIQNNTIGCLNLLWLIKQYCPDSHLIEIESMGTFCPSIGTPIPENKFKFIYRNKLSQPCLFPKEAGSFYHASKVFNTYLNDCANRWWGIKSTIINQGIVYGNYTKEIEQNKIHSHLAVDSCFGTVLNRFIAQAMLEMPLTLYGEGNQKRGFLALNDSVQCLELFVDNPPEQNKMRIVNQLDEVFSMKEIAKKVLDTAKKCYIDTYGTTNIRSPRVENTSEFDYAPDVNTLDNLGFKQNRTVEQEIEYSFLNINRDKLEKIKDLVMPDIEWK